MNEAEMYRLANEANRLNSIGVYSSPMRLEMQYEHMKKAQEVTEKWLYDK